MTYTNGTLSRRRNLFSHLSIFLVVLAHLMCLSSANAEQWHQIGFGQTSNRAPNSVNYAPPGAQVEADVYVYHANDNTNNIWYTIGGGPPQLMPATASQTGPTLAVFNGLCYIFHTGTDGNLYWDTLEVPADQVNNPQHGWHFTGSWTRVPGMGTETNGQFVNPQRRPALGVSANGFILIGTTFNDGSMRTTFMNTNNQFSSWAEIHGHGHTVDDIAICALDPNTMVILHRGDDSRIYYSISTPDGQDADWSPEPNGGLTGGGVSVVNTNPDYIIVAVRGEDNRVWYEVLFYNTLHRMLTNDAPGASVWVSIPQNFTNQDVGLGYLRGDAPLGFTNPTVLADLSDEGNLIERYQLN